MSSVVVFLLCWTVGFGAYIPDATREYFEKSKLIPDVLTKPPPSLLRITYYPPNKEQQACAIGDEFDLDETEEMPNLRFDAEKGKYYTVIMADPDAPRSGTPATGPGVPTFLHWLVINVNGSSHTDTGLTMVPYAGADPPPGSNWHRYLMLALEQDDGPIDPAKVSAKWDDDRRQGFNVVGFAIEHELSMIAGNYFLTKKNGPKQGRRARRNRRGGRGNGNGRRRG